jgi:methyltransferase (TIGR00027 family)
MSKRIENKVSITALGTCLMRATSYYEKDISYKSEDVIASMIIPSYLRAMIRYPISRSVLKKALFKIPGIYEYIILRTKFIDEIFNSLAENMEQVLILGAGFDSRAIRFKSQLKNVQVFELDAPITQQAKKDRFAKRKIDFPDNLNFISIDFMKESLREKLKQAGFEKNKKCLFLLEGLTYYLNQKSIDDTFNLINEYSAKDSVIVFDYAAAAAVRQEKIDGDIKIKKHYETLVRSGEKPDYMIEGPIEKFLGNYRFDLIKEEDSTHLAPKYFNKDDLERVAQKFRIVKAIKKV